MRLTCVLVAVLAASVCGRELAASSVRAEWQPDAECPLGITVDVYNGRYGAEGQYSEMVQTPNIYTRKDGLWRLMWTGCEWRVQQNNNATGWSDYFWADWPAEGALANCTSGADANTTAIVGKLHDASLCDAWAFDRPVPNAVLSRWCPKQQDCMEVQSFQYCRLRNIGRAEAGAAMLPKFCYDKCVATTSSGCEGTDPFDTRDSDALCVDRSECEQLCRDDARCVSVDMHKWKPRCYLNKARECVHSASPAVIAVSGEYDMLTLHDNSTCYPTTVQASCDQQNINMKALPAIHKELELHLCSEKCDRTKQQCTGPNCFCDGMTGLDFSVARDRDEALCLPREMCEDWCTRLGNMCSGVDVHRRQRRCYLNTVNWASCPTQQTGAMQAYDFAEKRNPVACGFTVQDEMNVTENYAAPSVTSWDEVATVFTSVNGTGKTVEWNQCGWQVKNSGGLAVFNSYDNHDWWRCQMAGTVMDPSQEVNDLTLFWNTCPLRPDMNMSLTCHKIKECPILTRCIVTDQQMSKELREHRWAARDQLMSSATSSEHYCSRDLFDARQIASPSRVEAVFDTWRYRKHWVNDELYRDEPFALRARFQQLSHDTHKAIVSMAAHEDSAVELNATYALPVGYRRWVGDVIRVERMKRDCSAVDEADMKFEIFAPDVRMLQVFRAELPSRSLTAVHEVESKGDGWWKVEDENAPGVSDFVIAEDINECESATLHGCSGNATCLNRLGSHECQCNDGYRGNGIVCTAVTWQCDPIVLRVSNGQALSVGLRLREIRIFADDDCTAGQEVVDDGPVTQYPMTANQGCAGGAADDIHVYTHPREIVRQEQCATKCRNQAPAGMARRLAADPACAGATSSDVTSANTLCLDVDRCSDLCTQLDDCRGFEMVGLYKCTLKKECTLGSRSGTNFHAKSMKFELTSSATFEEHPVTLVHDSFGRNGEIEDNYNYTEWWSDCFQCDTDEAWVELKIRPPASKQCKLGSVQVYQDPENNSPILHFHRGVGGKLALANARGVRPDYTHERPIMPEPWTHEWRQQSGKARPVCHKLSCDEPELQYFGSVMKQVQRVPSPCHCKQLCLDHLEDGCRAWQHYEEQDSNWHPGALTHSHMICFLLAGPIKRTRGRHPLPSWRSGGVGTIVRSFSPRKVAADTEFKLQLTGVGFPILRDDQRVKIVKFDDECSAEAPETVTGLDCDEQVCSPAPVSGDEGGVMWANVKIAAQKTAQKYKVCYCQGPCFAGWQYTPLEGALELEAATYMWNTRKQEDGAEDLVLYRNVSALTLTIKRPSFSSYEATHGWRIRVAAAEDGCKTNQSASYFQAVDGVQGAVSGTDQANWTFAVNMDFEGSKKLYVVCFCSSNTTDCSSRTSTTAFSEIAGDGRRFLELQPLPADLEFGPGVYDDQTWTLRAGREGKIDVKGVKVKAAFTSASLRLVKRKDCTKETSADPTVSLSTIDDDEKLSFTWTTPLTAEAGKYSVCLGTNITANGVFTKKIGTLAITKRVDIRRTYIWDPENANSIEVTGTDLNWKTDRLMIIEGEGKCGVDEVTTYVDEPPADEKIPIDRYNHFVPLNSEMDTTSDEQATPIIDKPSNVSIYTSVLEKYCIGNNINVPNHIAPDVRKEQCFTKCGGSSAPCSGSSCHCSGYYPGYDTSSTNALCLDETACKSLCSSLDECYGIDMHRSLPRCFLNLDGCRQQNADGALATDTSYDFLYKRQLVEYVHNFNVKSVTTVDAKESSFSTDSILRFSPFRMSVGGSFKVCFCDSTTLPLGQSHCERESDYAVELGEVFVTGIYCLLKDPKQRKYTCRNQVHHGLHCGDYYTDPAPSSVNATVLSSQVPTSSWSLLPPEIQPHNR